MKLFALLLLLPSFAYAQPSTPIVIFADGNAGCKTLWDNGKPVYVIEDENATVAVTPAINYSASLHSFRVVVMQNGATTLDIDPSKFSAVADDADHTPLPYLDMDARAEQDRKHKARVSNMLLILAAGASGAAAGTPQTATVNNSNGTSSTVTYTDPNAQARVNEQSASNSRHNRDRLSSERDAKTKDLLRHTTSTKGVAVNGTVYFEGPKHMKATKKGFTPVAYFDLPINGIIYRFQ